MVLPLRCAWEEYVDDPGWKPGVDGHVNCMACSKSFSEACDSMPGFIEKDVFL